MDFRVLTGQAAREADPNGTEWPDSAYVLFAFDADRVVGRVALLPIPHIEGFWLAEDKRKGALGLRLMSMIEAVLKADGKTHAMAFSFDEQPEVGGYLARLGYSPLPVTTHVKELT